MVRTSPRVFAIGLKGWVELMTSPHPPLPRTTSLKKSYTIVMPDFKDMHYYYNHRYRYRMKKVRKTAVMTTTIYTGGVVMASIKSRRFTSLTKLTVHAGGMCELPPFTINLLTEKGIIPHAPSTPAVVSPPSPQALEQDAAPQAAGPHPSPPPEETGAPA